MTTTIAPNSDSPTTFSIQHDGDAWSGSFAVMLTEILDAVTENKGSANVLIHTEATVVTGTVCSFDDTTITFSDDVMLKRDAILSFTLT